ncbi:hypothetical protein BSKO_00222 [Bryopsis sp. KO-2023]|nr:hypothetical protein BSKO_00222 [Bryopsis sp. KO-2023]
MDCSICSSSNSPVFGQPRPGCRRRINLCDHRSRHIASRSIRVKKPSKKRSSLHVELPFLGSQGVCQRPPLTGPPTVCYASSGDDKGSKPNLMESFKSEKKLQSTRLDSGLREKVTSAVEGLGNRVTVGDVAGRAGVSLFKAEEALKALAADSSGALEVSEEGEVVYIFSRGFRNAILTKSIVMRWEPALKRFREIAGSVARSAFGLGFVLTVVSVWLAIFAIMSSSNNRDERNSGGGRGMSYMAFDLLDAFRWWYYFSQPPPTLKPGEMGFMQAVYSVVFGDGNPNSEFEEERWNLIGKYIQSRGGVVVGEELAPYLDPPKSNNVYDMDAGLYPDEGYMLPVLVRFGGEPDVDSKGNLLYVFPKFQQSATKRATLPPAQPYVQERPWKLTIAKKTQQVLVGLLAVANVVGVQILGNLLAETPELAQLAPGLVGLKVYAWSFVAIPLVRLFLNYLRNNKILERNEAREQAATLLKFPTDEVREKMSSARQESKSRVLSDKDMVFSSKKDTSQFEADDFDRRLSELGS